MTPSRTCEHRRLRSLPWVRCERALVKHPVMQLRVRAGERIRRALTDLVDRTDRNTDAEQVACELDHPRRGMRLRAVKANSAACKFGPNAEPPIPAGNLAVVLASHWDTPAGGCHARPRAL